MDMITGTDPVRWFRIDDWCHPPALSEEPDLWFRGDWVRYDNDCEKGKRTTTNVVGWAKTALDRMESPETLRACRGVFGFDAAPDPTLHGGGLHVTSPGGWLNCHLDYDRHPKLPSKRRAVNLIAFCHPVWEPSWGGEFYLADPMGNPVLKFTPTPGTLIGFETNDLSYHGVLPVTGPCERVTIASYLLTDATPANTRLRALFMPKRK